MLIILFFVAADAEGIGVHSDWLVLRRRVLTWAMAVKTILETQGSMHLYHLLVLAMADIARGRG